MRIKDAVYASFFDKDKLFLSDADWGGNVKYSEIIPQYFGFKSKSRHGLKKKSGEEERKSFLTKEKNGSMNKNIEWFAVQEKKWIVSIWIFLTHCVVLLSVSIIQ